MKISTLVEYGLPQVLVDVWREKQGEDLLPLQERAIKEHGLFDSRSLIISAPTSSGKTFCGELAAARALAERRKALFLVPLKALAEERYSEFIGKYEPLGIRVVLSTRDHHEFDRKIETGDFDLGIVIYEKFNQILIRNLDLLGLIDLIVVDELQMLADPSRGALLEMALLKALSSNYKCRIIGLSAVLSNAAELADWFDARLLVDTHRPVELRQGVLFNDKFSFRCFNSGERGTESMAPVADLSTGELLLENVARLVTEGEQTLVFLKCKAACVQLALLLAERLPCASCEEAVEELFSGDETLLREPLVSAIKRGIAFHHADLSYRERGIIERYYLSGKIRAVFATTTLSLGLNLPAQTVFLETYKYRQGEYTGRPRLEALSWNEYENMCGRAGRLGFSGAFGRSVIVASNEIESEALWRSYVHGKPDRLVGRLFSRNLADVSLDLVVAKRRIQRDGIVETLRSTFSDVPEDVESLVGDAAETLLQERLISDRDGVFSPTTYGQKLASLGVSVRTGSAVRRLFSSSSKRSSVEWLYELCDSFEGRGIHAAGFVPESADQEFLRKLRSLLGGDVSPAGGLGNIVNDPVTLDRGTTSRIRLVLALHDWTLGRDLREIESDCGIHAGTIQNAGETIGWLTESAFVLLGTLGIPVRRRAFLKKLSFECRHGVPSACRRLHSIAGRHLSRCQLLALYREGISTPHALLSSDRSFLAGIIGHSRLEALMESVHGKVYETDRSYGKAGRVDGVPRRLHLTGLTFRDRFRISLLGVPILLTPKSFKYLFKLAAHRKLGGDGWLDKEQLEPGFNQARYLYNLKKEMGTSHGRDLIENDRRGAYRIAVPPDEIAFDFASLTGFEDFEVADLTQKLMAQSS
jgi:helicase